MAKAVSGRYTDKDKNGNEWMNIAQYVRAVKLDFDVEVSRTLVSLCKKDTKKFAKRFQKKVGGKECINYTQTVITFFNLHPLIAPPKETLDDWKKGVPVAVRKQLPEAKEKPAEKDKDTNENEEDEISIIKEKALHEKLKRQKTQFEFEVMQGNFIHIEDVAPALQTIAVETRQRVMSCIPRVKVQCAHETDPHKIDMLLTKELTKALAGVEEVNKVADGSYQEEQLNKQAEEMEYEA